MINALENLGAAVSWSDPVVGSWQGKDSVALGGADIAVVVTVGITIVGVGVGVGVGFGFGVGVGLLSSFLQDINKITISKVFKIKVLFAFILICF